MIAVICACTSDGNGVTGKSVSREELIYEISGDPLLSTIRDNPPWNYQQLYELGNGVALNSGDKVRIEVEAASDRRIDRLQAFIVDTIDGTGWKMMSGNTPVSSGIKPGAVFSFSKEIRITTTSLGDHIAAAFTADYSATDAEPILTFFKFNVIRIPE